MRLEFIPAAFFLLCIATTPASAGEPQPEESGSALSLRWENDGYGDTDEYYSNGGALAFTHQGKGIIGGVWDILGKSEGKRYAAYDLGQLIFTPADTWKTVPDTTDRPYAGFLYLGTTTFLRRDESLHGFKLMLGVVGPASLGETIQKSTHRAIKFRLPQGWDHQIKNEPIVNLHYEYRRKVSITPPKAGFGVELLPMAGASLGNFLTEAEAKLQLRMGYNLPDDFGTTELRGIGFLPSSPDNRTRIMGAHLFAGGSTRLVARNITLDGNSFAESRSVDKRLFLPMAEFGLTLWVKQFEATVSYIMMGEEFYGQRRNAVYGSLLVSYLFR